MLQSMGSQRVRDNLILNNNNSSICLLIYVLTHFCFIVRFLLDIGTPNTCKTLSLPLRASGSDDLRKINKHMA